MKSLKTVNIDEGLHKEIKVEAALNEKTIQEMVEALIRRSLELKEKE